LNLELVQFRHPAAPEAQQQFRLQAGMAQGKSQGALRPETEANPRHAVRIRPPLTLQIFQQGRELRLKSITNLRRSGFRTWVTQMVQDMGNTGHGLSISLGDAMEKN
jgi:hypothetical protein